MTRGAKKQQFPSNFGTSFVKGLGTRLESLFKRLIGKEDPVANVTLLHRIESYASIVVGKPVICKWGPNHATDLNDIVTLNPFDPCG